MQSLFRFTVMLGALVAAGWAIAEFGLENTLQPVARRAIMLLDQVLTPETSSSSKDLTKPADANAYVPPLKLVADPAAGQMRSVLPARKANEVADTAVRPVPPELIHQRDELFAENVESEPTFTDDAKAADLLQQLQELGARNVTVKKFGDSSSFFRCCCELPLADIPFASYQVDMVAEDADTAVEQVIGLVKARQAKPVALVHRQ